MTDNKISVIVPVYNVEEYLAECVESILQQTYDNLEVILIDDGSTDLSPTLCDKYELQDKRVKVIHKQNEGVSKARNTGIQVASGNYIGFVDSDDWLESNAFEVMLRTILSQESQMCACTKYIENGKVLSNSRHAVTSLSKIEAMKNLLNYNFPTSLWSCLYKREALENTLLNENIHHLEDLEYQFRVLAKIDRISLCDEAFYHYRVRTGSANSSGFNPKILSCLNMVPIIEQYIAHDPQIDTQYSAVLKCRLTLTVGSFVSRSKIKEKKYYSLLKNNARSCWLPTILSAAPLKKKVLLTLIAVDPRLYMLPYRIIKS